MQSTSTRHEGTSKPYKPHEGVIKKLVPEGRTRHPKDQSRPAGTPAAYEYGAATVFRREILCGQGNASETVRSERGFRLGSWESGTRGKSINITARSRASKSTAETPRSTTLSPPLHPTQRSSPYAFKAPPSPPSSHNDRACPGPGPCSRTSHAPGTPALPALGFAARSPDHMYAVHSSCECVKGVIRGSVYCIARRSREGEERRRFVRFTNPKLSMSTLPTPRAKYISIRSRFPKSAISLHTPDLILIIANNTRRGHSWPTQRQDSAMFLISEDSSVDVASQSRSLCSEWSCTCLGFPDVGNPTGMHPGPRLGLQHAHSQAAVFLKFSHSIPEALPSARPSSTGSETLAYIQAPATLRAESAGPFREDARRGGANPTGIAQPPSALAYAVDFKQTSDAKSPYSLTIILCVSPSALQMAPPHYRDNTGNAGTAKNKESSQSSSRLRSDTAIKPSWKVQATNHPTNVGDVDKMVFEELKDHTSIVDTDKFLVNLLPVATEAIDAVLNTLKSNGLYADGRWTGFPAATVTLERELYGPFVKHTTAIIDACISAHEFHKLRWVQRPDSAPISLDKLTPASRPDVMALLNYHDADGKIEAKLRLEISGYEREIQTPKAGHNSTSMKDLKQKHARALKLLKELLKTQWLRVHLPVEFKRTSVGKDVIDGTKQLCRYMRHVLREQLDRRFALGLLFCKSSLSVWLCHRSGLIGTKTPFNIHTEPRKFIQVIIALACLVPARLGWDRTMKIYRMRSGESFHTTDVEVEVKDFSDSLYGTAWLITVPEKDGTLDGESYVTVHALSTVRASVMCGRATVVWVVMNLRTHDRFVLKQTWRSKTSLREKDICDTLPHSDGNNSHVCEIVRSVDIGCQFPDPNHPDWVVEDTEHSITRGLEVEASFVLEEAPSTAPAEPSKAGKRKQTDQEPSQVDEEADLQEQGLFVVSTTSEAYEFAVRKATKLPPTNRILTRTLMKTYGWPIKFFKDIPELVRAIRDAVQGHRNLWSRNILHRDVSTGNLLICPKGSDVEDTSGCLIDLVYAKRTNKRVAYSQGEAVEPTLVDALRILVQNDWKKWQITLEPSAAETLISRYLGNTGDAQEYLKRLMRVWYLPMESNGRTHQLSTADVFTENVPKPSRDVSECDHSDHDASVPSWEDHDPQLGKRTGTTPFMSYELLTNRHYPDTRSLRADADEHTHSAIHDLESFFWVLVYLCVSRKGPGGARRDELGHPEGIQDADTRAVHSVVHCLFDSDEETTLAGSKLTLFESPEDFNEYIFPRFHPYFEVLKPLVSTWWKVLRLGYFSYDAITQMFIHQRILDILDDFLKSFVPETPSLEVAEATEKELERRRKDLDQYVLSQGFNTRTPPREEHTLPMSGDGTSKGYYADSPEKAMPKSTSYKERPPSPSPPQKKRKGPSTSSRPLHG
ncbi:hypothetical protein EVG20_g8025 [Dentipellis fragilis]|uniref:Fungal-type protein kinase domain-containing protein n=1 Tax=Dentipellis fragilis TaxID=205917 RepID=A0A4Y9YD14_9AGAM|nr:hypothetical protein EVG20_g8025 [Dentipellis fragilis]